MQSPLDYSAVVPSEEDEAAYAKNEGREYFAGDTDIKQHEQSICEKVQDVQKNCALTGMARDFNLD
jgi:hypothetical protein